MKEGKQQRKYQIKVTTTSGVDKVFHTHNHLRENKVFEHTELVDILHQASTFAAETHMTDPIVKLVETSMAATDSEMLVVPTSLLTGVALDYAVAQALNWVEPFHSRGDIMVLESGQHIEYQCPNPNDTDEPLTWDHTAVWNPSTNMALAARLMKIYKISVTPSTVEVQSPNIIAGYKPTDFHPEIKIEAETYERAICLVVVMSINGPSTVIPAQLESSLV